MPQVIALIVAAGRGERLGGAMPKQFRRAGPRTLLGHALSAFSNCATVDRIIVVINRNDTEHYREASEGLDDGRLLPPAIGGPSRQESVRRGLEAVGAAMRLEPDAIVLVHDAARPFVPATLIERAIESARRHEAAIPVLPVSDTIKLIDAAGMVVATPDRASLRAVQTPQAFRLRALSEAHQHAAEQGRNGFTDDAAVMEWAGHAVATFEGDASAFKVTLPDDLDKARKLVDKPDARTGRDRESSRELRVATGYDVHALGEGDHIWLGGVRIPNDRALIGHSDADPVLHALTDALLGAIGDGDIGVHFPPSDPRWRGVSSSIFLADAARRVRARNGRVVHLDVSIVCEAPRIGPHREAMRQAIADAAGVVIDRVGLKATTSEKLGFTGRGEGIAALATATVELPA